jgi:hypothetical protein
VDPLFYYIPCERSRGFLIWARHSPSPETEKAMTTEPRLAKTALYSAGTAYQASTPRKRNLGGAIFLAAIEDYRGSK